MTATPPRADLRTLAAEEVRAYYSGAGPNEAQLIADAVLAAVLPEHRRMVLTEAASALQHRADNVPWSDPDIKRGVQYAHSVVVMLARPPAAAAPPAGPSAPAPAGTTPAAPEADGRPAAGGPYRVGRKVGRTIYRMVGNQPSDTDELIGVMDSPALAAFAVRGMNADTEMDSERDRLAAQVAQDQPVVEAAKAWRAARPGPWVSGTDVEFHLLAAVDALPDVGTDQTEDDRG